MSTKAGKENNPNGSGPGEESSEGGLVPAILAGAGILAVVGLLVFWPSGDDDAKSAKDGDKQSASAKSRQRGGGKGKDSAAARGGGGVAARAVDDATPGSSVSGKVNPALLPKKVGMAPGLPQEEPPPKFENVEDEIAWYENKLEKANTQLEARERNVERLAKSKQKAEDSPDPGQALVRYERSKKIVEGNLEKAKTKVAEIEKKLSELRGE
jgi:hypothetical protein